MGRALELIDPRDPRVEETWRMLEQRARPSYFLSWSWVENWLASLPRDQMPPLAVIRDHDEAVAAFFLGRAVKTRHLVLRSRALYFNATGSKQHDEVCIEHNGLLAAAGMKRSLRDVIALLPDDWDELYLPAIDRDAFEDLDAIEGVRVRIDKEAAAPFIDLEAVRAKDYVSLLGSSTRSQLRRARRNAGDVSIEVAADYRHALDIYGELLRLHARRWNALGQTGAFADPWFERLHRRLIEHRLAHGEIQLVRVSSKDGTIGCLYNFVHDGRVLFYQSGLTLSEDPHAKPGFVTHAAAIEHNANAGHAVYDLLGGDARYKQQLATGASTLLWLRVQRPLTRFSLEDRLRELKRSLATRPNLALRPA